MGIEELNFLLVGKNVSQANKALAVYNLFVRPLRINGVPYSSGCGYIKGSVNVEIENGIITTVNSIG